MKTIADFKHRLIVGTEMKTTYHLAIIGRNENLTPIYGNEDKGIRPVSKVQSNSFALKTTNKNGTIVDSWCAYPKSKEAVFNNENSITILEEQRDGKMIPVLTYEFIND